LADRSKASSYTTRNRRTDAPKPAPSHRFGTTLQQPLRSVGRVPRGVAHFVIARLNVDRNEAARLRLGIVDMRPHALLEKRVSAPREFLAGEASGKRVR
jgi:hypothetical protein